MTIEIPLIHKYQPSLGKSLHAITDALGATNEQTDTPRSYEKMKELTWLHAPLQDRAHYYFKDDQCVMIYLDELNPEVMNLSPGELRGALGEPEEGAALRSRAGKRSQQFVYPKEGIAFSFDGATIEFIEVFAPTTLEKYLDEIYEEPAAFKL